MSEQRRSDWFATTRWSLVVAAGGPADARSREALEQLCTTYWQSVYAYVRRHSRDAEEAQDLTQGFFTHLLEKKGYLSARRDRGRFRAFLLASVKHYLANERDRAHAAKRGGGRTVLSLDFGEAESSWVPEPVENQTPEKLFFRKWALTVLAAVLASLREEYEASNRGPVFEALKDVLTGGVERPYAEIGAELGMDEGAVKVAAHRLRKRYRDRLKTAIADTVGDPSEIDDELRFLLEALA